jgi:hypothetical protein
MVDFLQKQLESQPSTAGLTILRLKRVTTPAPWSYDDDRDHEHDDHDDDMATLFQSKVFNLVYYFIVYCERNTFLNFPLC